MKFLSTTLILLLQLPLQAQTLSTIDGSIYTISQVDNTISRLQEAGEVHGLAVSLFTNDSLLFQKAYGFRNIRQNQPLKTTHNFYAASLSKPLFAYIVMKLVEKKQLDLDTPLINYLSKPLETYPFEHGYEGFHDIVNDARHQKITARMCLTHTTGFPNWRYLTKRGINWNIP